MPGLPAAVMPGQAVAFTNHCIAVEHMRNKMFATVFTTILCPGTRYPRMSGYRRLILATTSVTNL